MTGPFEQVLEVATQKSNVTLLQSSNEIAAKNTFLELVARMHRSERPCVVFSTRIPGSRVLGKLVHDDSDLTSMYIIDCLSPRSRTSRQESESVFYVSSASALSDISITLHECLRELTGAPWLVVHLLSDFLCCNSPAITKEFLNICTNTIISRGGGVLLIDSPQKGVDTRDVLHLCDNVVEIKGEI